MAYIGETAALTGAFFWGLCAIMFEAAGRRIGAFSTNLLRIVFAVILLCLTLLIYQGTIVPLHATREQILWLGLSGIVGLAIGDGALFICLIILGPRLATLLLSLAPPITALLAWFLLGEKLGTLALTGIALTVWGIFWVVNEKKNHGQLRGSKVRGVIMGLVAALGQGVGIILAKYGLQGDIDGLSATILRMIPAALVLWIWAFFSKSAGGAWRALRDKKAALATTGGSVFGPYLGVWLSIVAVKHIEAGVAATLLATVPILIIPMVIVTQRTLPTLRAIIGTVVAVIGIALLFLR